VKFVFRIEPDEYFYTHIARMAGQNNSMSVILFEKVLSTKYPQYTSNIIRPYEYSRVSSTRLSLNSFWSFKQIQHDSSWLRLYSAFVSFSMAFHIILSNLPVHLYIRAHHTRPVFTTTGFLIYLFIYYFFFFLLPLSLPSHRYRRRCNRMSYESTEEEIKQKSFSTHPIH
jgi:hypothetical protein